MAQLGRPAALLVSKKTLGKFLYADLTLGALPAWLTATGGANATITTADGRIASYRGNQLTNSTNIGGTGWSTNATVSAGTIVAPDGTTTAAAVMGTAADSTLQGLSSGTVAGIYTASVWLKVPSGTTSINLYINGGGNTVAVAASLTTTWQLFKLTYNQTQAGAFLQIGGASSFSTNTVIHVWHPQLELGSIATPYIPTTTAAVTIPVAAPRFDNRQVTNLATQSGSLSTSPWALFQATATTGFSDPLGGNSAIRLLAANGTGEYPRTQVPNNTFPVTAGATYTVSVYAKYDGVQYFQLQYYDNGTEGQMFDLLNGVVGATATAGTIISKNMIAVGGGWYRCSMTLSALSTATGATIALALSTANSNSPMTGDGSTTAGRFFGVQLEAGSVMSDYVPTTTAAVTANVPRGLLIEEARTNVALQSGDQTQSAWGKSGTTVATSTKLSPDGVAFMSLQTSTASGSGNYVRQSASTAAATPYTISAYFSAGTAPYLNLQISDFTANAAGIAVNTATLAITNSTAGDGSIVGTPTVTSFGNGIYRATVTISFTNAHTTTLNVMGTSAPSATTTSGQTIYIWGAQLEAGAFPTSYIPTTTAAVTRSADVMQFAGAGLSFLQAPISSAVLETGPSATPNSTNSRLISIPSNPSVLFQNALNSSGYYNGSTVTSSNAAAGSFSTNLRSAYSQNYSVSLLSSVTGGGIVVAGTNTFNPAANSFFLGSLDGTKFFFNGYVRKLALYNYRLPDTQLQANTVAGAPLP